MLRLAEIEAGSARSRFLPVDVAQLVEKVADAYRPDVEALRGTLTTTSAAPLTVMGDPDLLAQALANLIENAMIHSGEAPVIGVSTDGARGGSIVVFDNGPGIPDALRDSVLAPFARLDASRTTPGSGLGLTIAAAVCRLHGAAIRLEDGAPGLRVVMDWREAMSPIA